MFSSVTSGGIKGIQSYMMQVETDISDGLPTFSMVGLIGTEIKEAGERVRAALRNAGIHLPPSRITINFSPAGIPKRTTAVDLPMAASLLCAMGEISVEALQGIAVYGELGLDGEVKPLVGVLPMVQEAKKQGIHTCILPADNQYEGAVIPDIRIVGVTNLKELILYLKSSPKEQNQLFPPCHVDTSSLFSESVKEGGCDFAEIHGQVLAKRVLEIAAAGFHNALMVGPPGSGKSMLAKCMPGIMPRLSFEESMEVSSIYSVNGSIPKGQALITTRPFQAPHHTISEKALVGGGMYPKPGVISLADRGVLFLDEFPEFGRECIDLLREPLEEHEIRITRSGGTYCFPCRVLLLAAMNPCPCGFYPDHNKCRCSPPEINRYRHRISGPIMDRIDLQVEVPRVKVDDLLSGSKEESSEQIRKRVEAAVEIQQERFRGLPISFNADMSAKETEEWCHLGLQEVAFMEQVYTKLSLSARSYHRILKVARTIADLDGSREITRKHLAETVGYRMGESNITSL